VTLDEQIAALTRSLSDKDDIIQAQYAEITTLRTANEQAGEALERLMKERENVPA